MGHVYRSRPPTGQCAMQTSVVGCSGYPLGRPATRVVPRRHVLDCGRPVSTKTGGLAVTHCGHCQSTFHLIASALAWSRLMDGGASTRLQRGGLPGRGTGRAASGSPQILWQLLSRGHECEPRFLINIDTACKNTNTHVCYPFFVGTSSHASPVNIWGMLVGSIVIFGICKAWLDWV